LKPANILLDGQDRPVLIDFGLVKHLDEPAGLTRQGEVLGTPAYMAPEQAGDDPSQVGPASDVYALGAILYTLLTRRVPYDAGSSLATILKVVGPELPPPVRSLRPDVPEDLERICMVCLSKQPADRYATADDLAEELRRFREMLIRAEV
jgi:serine/threonine protein kinase